MSTPRCQCNPLENRGSSFNETIGFWFGQCVYNPSDYIGFVFGLINLMIWFYVYLPQIYANHKSRGKGLNPVMMLLWVSGDFIGLMGLLLTKQTGLILITQFYYFSMDFTMISQWFYFNKIAGSNDDQIDPSTRKINMKIDSEDYSEQIDDNEGYQGNNNNPSDPFHTSPYSNSSINGSSSSINSKTGSNVGVEMSGYAFDRNHSHSNQNKQHNRRDSFNNLNQNNNNQNDNQQSNQTLFTPTTNNHSSLSHTQTVPDSPLPTPLRGGPLRTIPESPMNQNNQKLQNLQDDAQNNTQNQIFNTQNNAQSPQNDQNAQTLEKNTSHHFVHKGDDSKDPFDGDAFSYGDDENYTHQEEEQLFVTNSTTPTTTTTTTTTTATTQSHQTPSLLSPNNIIVISMCILSVVMNPTNASPIITSTVSMASRTVNHLVSFIAQNITSTSFIVQNITSSSSILPQDLTSSITTSSVSLINDHINDSYLNNVLTTSFSAFMMLNTTDDGSTSTLQPIPSCAGTGLVGWQQNIGIVCAFICCCIYSPSRLPQIIYNYKRKSTYGISPQFICITFVAFFFYVGSILIPSARYDATNGYRSSAFWLQTFPYLASMIVGFIMNLVIAFQIYYYRDRTQADAIGDDISDEQAQNDEDYDFKVNDGDLLMGKSMSKARFTRSDTIL